MLDAPSVKRGMRFRVLQRDDFTCQYCGAKPPGVRLEVDHIIARSRGGRTREDNLITACFDCNQGKKAKELSEEQVARFSVPMLLLVPKPKKAPAVVKRRVYRRIEEPAEPDLSLCINCDGALGDSWPCPHCGETSGSYSSAMLRWPLSKEDRHGYERWTMTAARNRALGRCQCVRVAEVMGTICDVCLHDMAEEGTRELAWKEAEEYGCDCYECEWCEANQSESCSECDDAPRLRFTRYCAACFLEQYGEPWEHFHCTVCGAERRNCLDCWAPEVCLCVGAHACMVAV